MGVHTDTLDFFWETIGKDTSLKDKWMLELGDQYLRNDARRNYEIETNMSKVYFLNKECNHHSIDWNGLHGAVPIDMTKPIPIKRYINVFDIVTDFGCMEHIAGKEPHYINQWQAWKNIHDMGKVGCIYLHTVPLLYSYNWHGKFHYNLKFFEDLCEANNYKPILSRVHRHDIRTDKRDYVFSSYIKTENKSFVPDAEEFKGWLHR